MVKWCRYYRRVTRLDGAPDELSLLSLFREAADIAGIHGEIASQDTAVLRLLLAICHRAMDGPEDLDVWEEYWQTPGSLGRDAVDHLERHRERFDLRDPERPFFQVAGIRTASGKLWSLKSRRSTFLQFAQSVPGFSKCSSESAGDSSSYDERKLIIAGHCSISSL